MACSERFLSRLAAAAERFEISGTAVLIAVSGGADSVALLCGLSRLQTDFDLRISVGHFDHRLRGEASEQDARFVQQLCSQLGVACHTESADVARLAECESVAVEEAARKARYRFLERTAVEQGCAELATAHTADDQAETVLHHVIRGTGLRGLQGVPIKRTLPSGVLLLRPLLEITRRQVEEFLAGIGQDYRQDASNADQTFTRNRIRHRLIPLLKNEFNPRVDDALLRLAQQAAAAAETLEQLASELLQRATVDRNPTTVRLDCQQMANEPEAIVRESLVLLWRRQGWPRKRTGFADWDRLRNLIRGDGAATLPGSVQADRRGRLLVLTRK